MFKLLLLFILVGPGPIYSLSFTSSQGKVVHLSDYQGKKILIVNTASGSAKANQYLKLELLYQKYKDSLVVIVFPSNDFGHEPDNDSVIAQKLISRYNIHFLVGSRTSVSGIGQHSVFKWLTNSEMNGRDANPVGNDFYKFLIDEDGNWLGVYSDDVDPMSPELQNAIKPS
jgi:glutathione peroxidase